MVLKPSQFTAPKPGEQLNPMDPVNFIGRMLGMTFVLGAIVFALGVGRNRVAPIMNNLASSLTGGFVSSGGSSGSVWDDA